MSVRNADGYRITATDHATQRFVQRVGPHATPYLGADLRVLFDAGVPVGLPHRSGRGRLHPPSGAVLVYTDHPTRDREYLIKTVFRAELTELNDDHLLVCEACERRYDPADDDACPWCEEGSADD